MSEPKIDWSRRRDPWHDAWPLRLRTLGYDKDGHQIVLGKTQWGSFCIIGRSGSTTVFGSYERALAYADYVMGKGPFPSEDLP